MVGADGALYVVPYGTPAVDTLARVIAGAKAPGPLAPVTVLAPSGLAALTLRRRIARDAGVIAVDFSVLHDLAGRLAAPRLAATHRPPLTPLQAGALARAVIAREQVPLGDAVEHQATIDALVDTFAELRPLGDGELARLSAASPRARDVVALYRAFRRAAAGWADDHDTIEAAIDVVRAGADAVDEAGHVVLHLPRRLGATELALLAALVERGRLSAIVGTTGRAAADAAQQVLVDQLVEIGLRPAQPPAGARASPPASTIVRAADPPEEARIAVRTVIDRLGAGIPADRIAIVSRVESPYALAVHEELTAAGIAHHAPAPRTLAQSTSGRALLGLLAWPVEGHRRDDLMRLLRSAPIRDPGGGRVDVQHWDRLARDAGVVGGLEQWRQRLDAARAHREATRSPTDDEAATIAAKLESLDALQQFVERLAAATDPGARTSWRALASWAKRLLVDHLDRGALERAAPSAAAAHTAVVELLDQLGELDSLDPAPGPERFRRIVDHELHRPGGRSGRFGHGVFVGRLVDAVGADLDTVIVLGCAEGTFPPRGADDPLLPERDRAVLGGALTPRGTSAAEEERDAAAVATSAADVVVTFPIADPRDQHSRHPAPFVLELCGERLGTSIDTDGVGRLGAERRAAGWFVDVPSFESWLATRRPPATPSELDIAELLAARAAGQPLDTLAVVAAAGIERGLAAAGARRSGEFGEWSGRVGARPELGDALGRLRSATSLEHWAVCPFRYFVGHVLEVRELDDPGEEETITATDRGTLVHQILEQYVRAQIDGRPVSLGDIASEVEASMRASGRTGRDLLWRADWAALRRHLDHILEAGELDELLAGLVPVAVEYRFGFDDGGAAEVTVELGDGRSMRFRGVVDRIDRSPDGSRVVVLDYKTGSSAPYARLAPDAPERDIVASGTLLQLPVYARAARDRYPDAAEIEAYYWLVGQRGPIERRGGPIDRDADDRFVEVLRTIADGVEGGMFPARPGEEVWLPGRGTTYAHCRFCPFDALCPSSRGEHWESLRRQPELRAYVELVEGVVDGDGDGDSGEEQPS